MVSSFHQGDANLISVHSIFFCKRTNKKFSMGKETLGRLLLITYSMCRLLPTGPYHIYYYRFQRMLEFSLLKVCNKWGFAKCISSVSTSIWTSVLSCDSLGHKCKTKDPSLPIWGMPSFHHSLLAANLPDNKLNQPVNQKSSHPQDCHSFLATQEDFASFPEGKAHLLSH